MEPADDDANLLQHYVRERSETAFRTLVERHVGLVYHTARRLCGGDGHRAEDVAQVVFAVLARKAAGLVGRGELAGWLHTATRHAARQAMRAEWRRQERERRAAMTAEIEGEDAAADGERLRPLIDEALAALGERDRDLVLLRFFEGLSFAEIGRRVTMNEDAARVRTGRALERMRAGLARRGMTSTTAALAVALGAPAGAAVPGGLAASVATAALAGGGGVAVAAITFMTIGKLQIGVVAAVFAAGATALVWQQRSNARLRTELAEARSEPLAASAADTKEVSRKELADTQAANGAPAVAPGAENVTAAVAAREQPSAPEDGRKLGAGLVEVKSLGDLGQASPRAAWSTQLWAARVGDVDKETGLLELEASDRERLAALIAKLPAEARAKFATPEALMATMLAGSRHPVGGMQVLGETLTDADHAVLQTEWQHEDDGIVHHSEVTMHRTGDGWKMVVPVTLVDRAIAYLEMGR